MEASAQRRLERRGKLVDDGNTLPGNGVIL